MLRTTEEVITEVAAGLDHLVQHGDDFCQLALQLTGRDSSIGADPTGTPGSAGWRGMLAAATTASVAAFAIARAAS